LDSSCVLRPGFYLGFRVGVVDASISGKYVGWTHTHIRTQTHTQTHMAEDDAGALEHHVCVCLWAREHHHSFSLFRRSFDISLTRTLSRSCDTHRQPRMGVQAQMKRIFCLNVHGLFLSLLSLSLSPLPLSTALLSLSLSLSLTHTHTHTPSTSSCAGGERESWAGG